jgi:hypothetical protein
LSKKNKLLSATTTTKAIDVDSVERERARFCVVVVD